MAMQNGPYFVDIFGSFLRQRALSKLHSRKADYIFANNKTSTQKHTHTHTHTLRQTQASLSESEKRNERKLAFQQG